MKSGSARLVEFRPEVVACLDVGSPKNGNVGWAVLEKRARTLGSDLEGFIDALAPHLASERSIALGFECPLYVPKRADVSLMTACRPGEVGLNWCGGPGGSVLATGLVQVNWVLTQLARRSPHARGSTRWSEFFSGQCQLYVWEAYITSRSGVEIPAEDLGGISSHQGDALCGALAFQQVVVREDTFPSDFKHEPALSLIGMNLVESGWSTDVTLMSEGCAVLKVRKPRPQASS